MKFISLSPRRVNDGTMSFWCPKCKSHRIGSAVGSRIAGGGDCLTITPSIVTKCTTDNSTIHITIKDGTVIFHP